MECAKPEKTAFSLVTNALKLRPAEWLLVDDTILNINGAKAAGWRTVLFTDAVQLQPISATFYTRETSNPALQR